MVTATASHQPIHAGRHRLGMAAVSVPNTPAAPSLMPTAVARATETGSQPSSTAVTRLRATSNVAPICPSPNATTSRPLCHSSSATANRHLALRLDRSVRRRVSLTTERWGFVAFGDVVVVESAFGGDGLGGVVGACVAGSASSLRAHRPARSSVGRSPTVGRWGWTGTGRAACCPCRSRMCVRLVRSR